MADDASSFFDLSDTSFLARMSIVYSHPLGLWQIYPPTAELRSCVISMLCRKALISMQNSRGCISSG